MQEECFMIKAQQLIADLKAKRSLANVYLILGQEQYLARQIKRLLIKMIPKDEQELNIGQYDMQETPITQALDDAISIPFFGQKRLVFIENPYFLTGESKKNKVEHDLELLNNYLLAPESSTTLIIFAPYEKLDKRKKVVKTLLKTALVVENEPLNERELKSYVNKYLQGISFTIQPLALDLLVARTNANLPLIMSELNKVMLAKKDDKTIDVTTVEQLVAISLEQDIFALGDLVLKHQVTDAFKLYKDLLLQKKEPLKLNALLVSQFRLLLQVKILQQQGYLQGDIVKLLKVHPYRVQLATKTIMRFSLGNLQNAFLGLIKAEEKLKSTNQAPELIFQMFLFEYCQN